MTEIRFNGGANAPDETTVYGITFTRGVWIDLEIIPSKLQANPEFEIKKATLSLPAGKNQKEA